MFAEVGYTRVVFYRHLDTHNQRQNFVFSYNLIAPDAVLAKRHSYPRKHAVSTMQCGRGRSIRLQRGQSDRRVGQEGHGGWGRTISLPASANVLYGKPIEEG